MTKPSVLRRVTRLVIGGALNGLDGLRRKMEVWEAKETAQAAETGQPASQAEPGLQEQPEGRAALEARPPALPAPGQVEERRDKVRLAMIGLVFSTGQGAGRVLRLAGRATRLAGNLADDVISPVARPVVNSRLFSPIHRRLDSWAARGEAEVEGWIDLGRQEEQASRSLAEAAMHERIENAIDYLTANEEVQELVQSQSAGLVDSVVVEARERTVSADNFLEALVRSVLHRTPRWELPSPPPEVRHQATPPRHHPPKRNSP
jgi:hypothetical protein